jgi:rhombotail lipoprotein
MVLAFALSSACTSLWLGSAESGQRKVSSSMVDYLFPDGMEQPIQQQASMLELPLRVGIAFVPPTQQVQGMLDEATKQELLDAVAAHFSGREYISAIEVVPETYLKAGRGFQTLDQVARLYGLDIMALVSYDQQTFTADTRASFWYWTIVGAYVVKGSQNDVSTFVDTAVFDIRSRKLLLRAPGTSQIEGKSTAVDVAEKLAESRVAGFRTAMSDMTTNLSSELDELQARLESGDTPDIQVSHQPGYTGGTGGAGPWTLTLLAGMAFFRRRKSPGTARQ